tara:strand:+ start:629 stop:1171 length:543 start_codon:yes stop_codon:yes gene_type:complete
VGKLAEQIEIRRYEQRLAVEATIDIPDYDDSRNSAFRMLFDYISGNNHAVSPASPGGVHAYTEVAMTTPVETSRTPEGGMRMRFFLPVEYTLETAPRPVDPKIRLIQLRTQLQAVLRFTGFAREISVAKRMKELLEALEQSSWDTAGEPVTYVYDPPWTIPFFRRNEIVIPVVSALSQKP